MHQSCYDQMKLCVEFYMNKDDHYRILDLGSRRVVGGHLTHADLLADYDVDYIGADVAAGPNVDLVMKKPYRIPLKSNSVDVVMTNQVFEHIPFPWASFLEMSRVVKPNGFIFVVAPSRGGRHGITDCWRYYPDSMRALAAFARMNLRESYVDMPPTLPNSRRLSYKDIDVNRAYWGDAVGVFQKPERYSKLVRVAGEVIIWWANRVGTVVPRAEVPPVRTRARRAVTRGPRTTR